MKNQILGYTEFIKPYLTYSIEQINSYNQEAPFTEVAPDEYRVYISQLKETTGPTYTLDELRQQLADSDYMKAIAQTGYEVDPIRQQIKDAKKQCTLVLEDLEGNTIEIDLQTGEPIQKH